MVDVTYTDPKTGDRYRERRIQQLADDEVEAVRARELALVLPSRQDQQELYFDPRRRDDYDDQRSSRGRRNNEDFLAVEPYRPQRARSYRGGELSRRRRSPSSSSSSDSEDDRRRRRHDRRRARSARPDVERDGNAKEDDEGILWYSGKPRKDCNFFERHFDSSYDGLLTAAAGAAIGAMTARRFAHKEGDEEKHKNMKTLGGAVAGAGLFNMVENHYRVFTEEKTERKEEAWEEKWGGEGRRVERAERRRDDKYNDY